MIAQNEDIGTTTHGTVHGAGSGRIHMTRLKVTGGRTVITAAAGSLMRASINLVQERANPALRAFSTAGTTARLALFTVAGVIAHTSSLV